MAFRVRKGQCLPQPFWLRKTVNHILAIAFIIWTVIALASTVDSFYCATSWFLKGKNLRSNSPLLALIPDNIASSPLWLLIGAAWVSFAAVPANFSLMYFMMPFATLFVSASANLVCEAWEPTRNSIRFSAS